MRTTLTLTEETYEGIVALSSYLSITEYGGNPVTQGVAVGEAVAYYYANHPEACAHRDLIQANKKK